MDRIEELPDILRFDIVDGVDYVFDEGGGRVADVVHACCSSDN